MLKISRIEKAGPVVTLLLEGRIVGPWVEELRRTCDPALRESSRLRLHLADVEFMDAGGVALLAELQSQGAALVESPLFIAEQLKATQQ